MRNIIIKNIKNTSKGFTLVELLVVIAIIGILAAIALASFTGAQKQARDTTRKSDLKQYQTGLETYAGKNSGLYIEYNAVRQLSSLCVSLYGAGATCPEDPKYSAGPPVVHQYYKYMSNPTDPTEGQARATEYLIWARIEGTANNYWVVCSNGKSGIVTLEPSTANRNCPL